MDRIYIFFSLRCFINLLTINYLTINSSLLILYLQMQFLIYNFYTLFNLIIDYMLYS